MQMTENYKERLKEGLEYQDFVMQKFIEILGIPINNYSSKKYQFNIGENKQGIEIKFDNKHKGSGNLFIEVAEKSNKNNARFVDSGIMRHDNAWLYLIGNYEVIYVFPIKYLRYIMKDKKVFTINGGTSRGFLLLPNDISKYCINMIRI